jgi:hypothetical protein
MHNLNLFISTSVEIALNSNETNEDSGDSLIGHDLILHQVKYYINM